MTTTKHPENIPQEQKDRDQWITWKYAKGTKLPCSVATGKVDDATDSASWGTFDQAIEAYQRRHHAGIGYVFTKDDPFTGVDLDDCVENGIVVQEDAAAIIAALPTYTEISPSETGVKLIVRAEVAASLKTSTPSGLKLEIYPERRFFAMTGNRLANTPAEIQDHSIALNAICDGLKPKPKPQPARSIATATIDSDHARRWCLAALEGERAKVEATGDNERHNRRLASARALGGLVPHITEQEIFDALAVNFGTNQKVAEQTIWDGIAYGKETPRDVPAKQEPTFDEDDYACCPTHSDRLIPCRNGNGYRCAAPKMGEPLCFWWKGEGYTPPTEYTEADDLDALDPDTLRQRLRCAIAERDQYRQQVEQLRFELGQVKQHNRFVTQTAGAEGIGSASMRLTFIEMKKEVERVPVEERDPDQFVRVRPAYMAKCTGQNRSTVSRHLAEIEGAGYIEKKVERTFDPETRTWCSETFIRPLVDLSDPTQVVIPSKPRGKQACKKCHGERIERQVRITCLDCGHEEWSEPEVVNASEAAVQSAIQDEDTTQNAADFFEQLADGDTESLKCNAQHKEKTTVLLSELQSAQQGEPTPNASELQIAIQALPHRPPLIDMSDPSTLPGVRAGQIDTDDSWFALQRALQTKAVTP